MNSCTCGSGIELTKCCGQYLDGSSWPETAEALMRSRYSAYVLGDEKYLEATWHPDFRPANVGASDGQKWLGLKVRQTRAGGPGDNEGVVEFVARFKVGGKGYRLHETSRFVRENNRWLYTDGDLHEK